MLSKIRTGNKTPSKPKTFIENVCSFVVNRYKSENDKKSVAILIGCNSKDLKDNSNYYNRLFKWLSTNLVPTNNYIDDFLNNLDKFDLNEYIKAIHFDEMKVPTIPFYRRNEKRRIRLF